MTFLSLHFPALVFREKPGLWGRESTEYLFVALQKAAPHPQKEKKGSPLLSGGPRNCRALILPCLQRDLADAQQCCSLTAVTQAAHADGYGCVPTPARENVCECPCMCVHVPGGSWAPPVSARAGGILSVGIGPCPGAVAWGT